MHRLIKIPFADLDIGDYFSYDRGRPRDIPVYQKTSEYRFKLIRGQFRKACDDRDTVTICYHVWRRMAPHKHHRITA